MCGSKVLAPRGRQAQLRFPEFANVSRITMLPVIFASGEKGRPMLVLKGKRYPFRILGQGDSLRMQSVASCLPSDCLITMRDEVADVDKHNFLHWARYFVEDVRPLTEHGRKVLLIYDGYRSHMSPSVLRVLRDVGIIAYCLPAHTSGVTLPLGVTVIGSFKSHLASTLQKVYSTSNVEKPLDLFDFCKIMKEAYLQSFTPKNMRAGFAAGIFGPSIPLRFFLFH